MKWKGRQGSSNVDDRRGGGGNTRGRRRGKRAGGLSIVGVIVVIIFSLITGQNPLNFMGDTGATNTAQQGNEQANPKSAGQNEQLAQFSKVVLKDTEDVWEKLFREQLNKTYQKPTMVIFNGKTTGACGIAGAATGPYYCPADRKIYMDLNFLRDLSTDFGAAGDFAMAYVIAHEVGHHIQHLNGITEKVYAQKNKLSKKEFNKLSVKLELQADYLAGMWAHHAQKMKNILEEGDIQEAIEAASAVGDDRLQKKAQGYVVPDAFTHGSSKQRIAWFLKGFKQGTFAAGNTFK